MQMTWVQFVTSLGPLIVSGYVAYIGYQNWRLSRFSFSEKLFSRRIEIFRELQEFVRAYQDEAEQERSKRDKVAAMLLEARYLFSATVSTEIEDMLSISWRRRRCRISSDREEVRHDEERWASALAEEERLEKELLAKFKRIEVMIDPLMNLSSYDSGKKRKVIGRLMGVTPHGSR